MATLKKICSLLPFIKLLIEANIYSNEADKFTQMRTTGIDGDNDGLNWRFKIPIAKKVERRIAKKMTTGDLQFPVCWLFWYSQYQNAGKRYFHWCQLYK